MAEGHRNRPPATIQAAETTVEELRLARIQGGMQQQRGWPELTGAKLATAAEARASAGAWFQRTGELVRGCVGLVVAPGARRRHNLERRCTVAARATTMADGGARVRRLA